MSNENPRYSRQFTRDSRVDALVNGVLSRVLENVRTGEDLAAGADPWQTVSRFCAASDNYFDEKLSHVMVNARDVIVHKI
jgi:hypothetical protein